MASFIVLFWRHTCWPRCLQDARVDVKESPFVFSVVDFFWYKDVFPLWRMWHVFFNTAPAP